MSMSDPIADMLTRIRNASKESHADLKIPCSNLKVEIARVLKEEGYVKDFQIEEKEKNIKFLRIWLKYFEKKPVISGLKRLSPPSRRVYVGIKEIPQVIGGLGIVIMSTPIGVITGQKAKKSNVGGELLCKVW